MGSTHLDAPIYIEGGRQTRYGEADADLEHIYQQIEGDRLSHFSSGLEALMLATNLVYPLTPA